jgi:uncharacterized protein (TIRG00374 family)
MLAGVIVTRRELANLTKQTKRYLRYLLLLTALALLIWFREPVGGWAVQEWTNARSSLEQSDSVYFFAAFLTFLASLFLSFHRWHTLLRAQDLPVSGADAIRLGFVGFVSSLFAPGSVTGDVLKAAFIAREQQRRTAAIATIIADRLFALYGLLVLASLMSLLYLEEVWSRDKLRAAVLAIWSLTAVGAAGLIVLFVLPLPVTLINRVAARVPLVGRLVLELLRALERFRNRRPSVAYVIFLSVIGHVGFVGSFYLCALALDGPTPTWQMHFVIIPAGMVLQAVPLAPGANLGVAEVIFSELYKMVGPQFVKGLTVCLAQRAVTWLVGLVGLVWYLPLRQRMKRLQAELRAEEAARAARPAPLTTIVDPAPLEARA